MPASANRPKRGANGRDKQQDTDTADDASAGDYAREALSEWASAARLGVQGIVMRRASKGVANSAEGVTDAPGSEAPSKLLKAGGKAGRALAGAGANWALSKGGLTGKLASKAGVGRKLVEGGDEDGDSSESGSPAEDEAVSVVPIQESINVAVPIALAYDLALRFEEYPQFLDHVEGVDPKGQDRVEFDAKLRGVSRRLQVEVFDTRENERIDWRSTNGHSHAGTMSFHELAPRLTHIELSVDVAPHGVVERLTRALHLPEHAVRTELQRFKAYAELYEEPGDEEFEPTDDEPEADEPEDDEPKDEQPGEEEPEDEDLEEEPDDEIVDEEPEDEVIDEEAEAETTR